MRLDTSEEGGGGVIAVVRLEEQKAVARIEQRRERGRECPGGAEGDHDLRGGIALDAVLAFELLGDRLPELARPLGERIGAAVLANGGNGPLAYERVRGNI